MDTTDTLAPPRHGMLRRRIGLIAEAGIVRAAVEDDFHNFRVTLFHDGHDVIDVKGTAMRQPWTLCGSAAGQLRQLAGSPLTRRMADALILADQFQQCTHIFDLAALCIAAAASGCAGRGYDIEVEDAVAGKRQARLRRDGASCLTWDLDEKTIVGPFPYADLTIGAGFSRFTAGLGEQEAEAALVLRRGVFIAGGRASKLDERPHSLALGGCFVQQPERAPHAARVKGSTWDFTDRPDALLAGDRGWLAGNDSPT